MPHATNASASGTTTGVDKRGLNGNMQVPIGVGSNAKGDQKTDYSRWRLKDDRGCQTWHYLQTEEEVKAWPQSAADKYFLGMETVCRNTKTMPCLPAETAADRVATGSPPTLYRKDTSRSRRKWPLLLRTTPTTPR